MLNLNIKKLNILNDKNELLNISFSIKNSTALIGESGSGKSLTLKALLNLLPKNLVVEKIVESNFDLTSDSIGFIPQNPFTSLSPMTKIKNQFFCEKQRKLESLYLVGLDETILNKFPNQLSGGQIQRVVIAIAISKNVKLLLLDEPTTALDIENKENIINLICDIKNKLNIGYLICENFMMQDFESLFFY